MYKLFVLLTLNTLKLIHALGTPEDDYENHEISHHHPNYILPMVMVKWLPLGRYMNPSKVYVMQPQNRMVFSTLFIYKEVFLCPREHEEYAGEAFPSDHITPDHYNQHIPDHHTPHIPEHCLFPKQFDAREMPHCLNEAIPVIEEIIRNEKGEELQQHSNLGHEGIGKLYSFQYKPSLQESIATFMYSFLQKSEAPAMNVMHFGLYTFCYNHTKKEIVYAEHVILSPNFIYESSFKQEQEKEFPMNTDGYAMLQNDFEHIRNQYIEKRGPISEQMTESHHSNESMYLAHQLVPADDMAFALWRKPTFHFANVKPMHRKLIPLWDHICEMIRLHAKKNYSTHTLKITTGAFAIPSQGYNNHSNTNAHHVIPDLWVKMVQDVKSKEGVAFVMSNFNDKILEYYCETDSCTFSHHFNDVIRYIRCCPISERIENLFGLKLNSSGFLKIEEVHTPQLASAHRQEVYYVLKKEMFTHQEQSVLTPPKISTAPPSSQIPTTKDDTSTTKVKIVPDTKRINISDKNGEGQKETELNIPANIIVDALSEAISKNIHVALTGALSHTDVPESQSHSQGTPPKSYPIPHNVNAPQPQPVFQGKPPETQHISHIDTSKPSEVNVHEEKTKSRIGTMSGAEQGEAHAAVSQLPQHNHSSQHILPLILMKNKFLQEYEMPSSVHYDQHSKQLTFSRFSTGDAMYFCPVEMEKPEQKKKIDDAIQQIRIRNSHEKTSDKKKQKLPESIFNRCLVRKRFGENEEIKCDHEAIPVIEKVRSDRHQNITDQLCGQNNAGVYYSFEYDLCRFNGWFQNMTKAIKKKTLGYEPSPIKEVSKYSIYKFCYDHHKYETIYTVHRILSPKLIRKPELELERTHQFHMQTNDFSIDNFFKNSFEDYKSALENDKIWGPNSMESEYEAQPLVPHEDFVFALWRKCTFHFANVRPMQKKLVPLWDYINQQIQSHAIKHEHSHFIIYTGVFQTDVENSFGTSRKRQLWVKVVQHSSLPEAVSIVMSENIESLATYCEKNMCIQFDIILNDVNLLNHICCSFVTQKIKDIFGTDWDISKYVMGIEGITIKKKEK